jgi:hypothetical protein
MGHPGKSSVELIELNYQYQEIKNADYLWSAVSSPVS